MGAVGDKWDDDSAGVYNRKLLADRLSPNAFLRIAVLLGALVVYLAYSLWKPALTSHRALQLSTAAKMPSCKTADGIHRTARLVPCQSRPASLLSDKSDSSQEPRCLLVVLLVVLLIYGVVDRRT